MQKEDMLTEEMWIGQCPTTTFLYFSTLISHSSLKQKKQNKCNFFFQKFLQNNINSLEALELFNFLLGNVNLMHFSIY